MKKKILSMFIVLLLVFTAIPFNVNATSSSYDAEAYRDVLNMYHTSISCKWSNRDSEGWDIVGDPDNVCYMLPHYSKDASLNDVGYTLLDINNDGQSELFISMFDIAESGSFYDMYTIVDGKIVHVIEAGERSQYKLAENLSINHHGSGGAALSSNVNYLLDNTSGALKVNQVVIYDGWTDSENPWFYATEEYYFNGSYDYDILEPISEETAKSIIDSFPQNKPLKLTSFEEYVPSVKNTSGFVIYSDYSDLKIRRGSSITLGAELYSNGKIVEDTSKVSFQVSDPSVLSVIDTFTVNNCSYIKFLGLSEGEVTVSINDSTTGNISSVNITVYDNNYLTYTLNSVPKQDIEKYTTNIYNFNGLYIDSYVYTLNDDQSANVSFDVYNSRYTYAFVEAYDENGNMKNVTLIDKMTSSNTSIKEAIWDNTVFLIRDLIDNDFLTYRQESGFSKKTSVKIEIPKNGYIKITNDPSSSFLVSFINSVDYLMSLSEITGDIADFDVTSKAFAEKLTKNLINEEIYAELIKDGSKAKDELWKNIAKEIFITPETSGDFAETICKNIDKLNLGKIIAETAASFSMSVGEEVFKYFSGHIGAAMDFLFTYGKFENIFLQQNDLIKSTGSSAVYIQNQGGGFRACQQIKVESDNDFSPDTSLRVFTVMPVPELLEKIKNTYPEIYEAMTKGTTHTYNISLIRNGNEIQSDGKVTVCIPIPEDLQSFTYTDIFSLNSTKRVKIYRTEADGSLTEMDVKIKNGCFVFTTEHFSLYTVVVYDFENPFFQKNITASLFIGTAVLMLIILVAVIIVFKKKCK